MYYDEELVEKVRESNDIVDVIGSVVHLTRRGSNYVGLCPFHNEKTGSFNVNRNLQIFKCFGCGKAGNVFTFMMEYDNLSFPEAMKELADRANISLPELPMTDAERHTRSLKDRILEVNREAAKYYYAVLRSSEGAHAMEYLTGRALSADTMKNFGLGFAGRYSNGLYNYLKSKGYDDEVLYATGLFSFSEKGASDKFWNRVMFPIMDKNGKVIAFGGRIMGKADNVPKYLNSPETPAFTKGNNLYGLHLARRSRKSYMLLCEGYMDVIALHQAGFDNAIASLGTALTPSQAGLISKYVHEAIITYDSDEAGRKAALRAIPILREAGIVPKVLDMKPYKDPDEFIKALGAEAYEKRIADARGAFFFETEQLKESISEDDPQEKTNFHNELALKLAHIEDELERNNYIEAAARQYGIDFAALKRKVNELGKKVLEEKLAKDTQERDKEQHRSMVAPKDGPVRAQQLLISMLANSEELCRRVKDILRPEDFTDGLCSQLAETVFNLRRDGQQIVHARMINNFEEVADQEKVAGILDSSLYEVNINEQERGSAFADLVIRVLGDSIEAKWQKALAENDGAAVQALLIRRSELDKMRATLMS